MTVVLTGGSPGRHLVDDRHVEVPVEGHRQGPRDRGGGHDQEVGIDLIGLLLEQHPLGHPEAMLLVDHGHPEPGEVDSFLDEGVGADQDVDLAAGHVSRAGDRG